MATEPNSAFIQYVIKGSPTSLVQPVLTAENSLPGTPPRADLRIPSSFPRTGPESAGFRTKSVRRKIREDPTFGSHSPDGQRHMKSIWRRHWIICLCLGLLTIPIYFLDLAL